MEQSKLRRIVEKNITGLLWALQLNTWVFEIKYTDLSGVRNDAAPSGGMRCCCDTRPSYRQATIEFDPRFYGDDDEDLVLEDLRHELLHVVHHDTTLLFETFAPMLSDGEAAAFRRMVGHVNETIVNNLEKMLDHGLGLDARAMMARAKAHSRREERRRG